MHSYITILPIVDSLCRQMEGYHLYD